MKFHATSLEAMLAEVVEEKTIQEEKRILNVLRILVDKLRTLFRI